MNRSYSMVGLRYGRAAMALLVSMSLVMATVIVCLAQRRWTAASSIVFMANPEPGGHSNQPRRQSFSAIHQSRSFHVESDVRDLRKYQYSTDEQLLQDAIEASKLTSAVTPRIAFLFLVREEIPFEPIWRRFFAGKEERYSLYVHTAANFTFPRKSSFFGREIPSTDVERMSRSLADAVRRLVAMALVDPEHYNTWFVNLCESTIPLRSFDETYSYLMGSRHSFVQAFQPQYRYWTLPHVNGNVLRKGEIWMALRRKHAVTLVADRVMYTTFMEECHKLCAFDERYFQTLLVLRDPAGIANRTVMFVDWSGEHSSSPRTFNASSTNARLLHGIASMTEDSIHGQHHDTALRKNMSVQCAYNGVPGAPCFLFARKFDPSSLNAAMKWLSSLKSFTSL